MNTERELAEVLAPCPFCGSDARVTKWMDEDLWSHNVVEWRRVDCTGCECATGATCDGFEPDAVTAWNTRHSPTLLSRADGGDSARYQWLKDGGLYRIGFDSVGGTSLDGLDAAVDSAMAEERGE